MYRILQKKPRLLDFSVLCIVLSAILLLALWTATQTGADFSAHSPNDSYTLQALAWREGRTYLINPSAALELAIYEGKYYVSFPPVPTFPMLLLSFFFGEQTPNAAVTLCYLLSACAVLFLLARRYLPRSHAALLTLFFAAGGSIWDITVSGANFSGAVWYQAQLLALLLTLLSFYFMDMDARPAHMLSLILIALSVGCRPLNAAYVPFLLYLLFGKVQKVQKKSFLQTLWAMVPYVLIPLCIAFAYGAYNMARFHQPFEFGHNYLPEFTRSNEPFFSFSRLGTNIGYILRPPYLYDGLLSFPVVCGFAVYFTNPFFVFAFGRFAVQCVQKKANVLSAALFVSIVLQSILLLLHHTNGGWQYGTRYLCDAVPALVYLFLQTKKPIRLDESAWMGALIVFNVYGSILFHMYTV